VSNDARKQYFKGEAESELGVGTAYLEITNGWPSRQVEVYGTSWRWGDEVHPEYLGDQPLDAVDLAEKYEISSAEFERVWSEALERCRPHS
jgi:hypothetical protein